MSIQAITNDGYLHWQCVGGEEDEHCLHACVSHVSEAVYRSGQSGPRGAVIDLPVCQKCGARCSLKADYTLRELFNVTLTLIDESGGVLGYALKMQHVHNLLVHHWLYQQGRAEHPPAVPMPARDDLSHPRMALLPQGVALALWFGCEAAKSREPALEFASVVREIGALGGTSAIGGANGN